MTTNVLVDDNLLAKAQQATGISDATTLVRDGLAALADKAIAHTTGTAAKPAPVAKHKPPKPLFGRDKGQIKIVGDVDLDEISVWPGFDEKAKRASYE